MKERGKPGRTKMTTEKKKKVLTITVHPVIAGWLRDIKNITGGDYDYYSQFIADAVKEKIEREYLGND
ncbi:MAG: hypothetical protein ACXAAH_05540 [Promethearchaeota archaeon]